MTLKLEWRAGWVAGALVLVSAFWILRSFIAPLAWASIVALVSWPAYRRFADRMPRRFASSLTPLLFTVFISLAVLGPMLFAFGALAMQARTWGQQLIVAEKQGLPPPARLEDVPLIGDWLMDQWHATLGTPGGVSLQLQHADAASLFGWAGSFGQFIAHHAFIVSFTLLGLFFLYRGGEALAGEIVRIVQSKLGRRGASYLERAIVAIRATVYGTIVVGLIDGALTGIAYALAGVPSAHLWGAVTGLFAMVPFLAYAAVVGVALMLFATGAGAAALAVIGLGIAVVFATDKIARPLLVGGAMKLGFLWVLLGSLGGFEALGLLGLFVGPVVLALAGTLLQELRNGVETTAAAGEVWPVGNPDGQAALATRPSSEATAAPNVRSGERSLELSA